MYTNKPTQVKTTVELPKKPKYGPYCPNCIYAKD
jgi:hypothetical protein